MLAPGIGQDQSEGRHLSPHDLDRLCPALLPDPEIGAQVMGGHLDVVPGGNEPLPLPQVDPDPQILRGQGVDPPRRQIGERVGLVERAGRRLCFF